MKYYYSHHSNKKVQTEAQFKDCQVYNKKKSITKQILCKIPLIFSYKTFMITMPGQEIKCADNKWKAFDLDMNSSRGQGQDLQKLLCKLNWYL